MLAEPIQQRSPTLRLGLYPFLAKELNKVTLGFISAKRYVHNVASCLETVDAEVDAMLARLSRGRRATEEVMITMRQRRPRQLRVYMSHCRDAPFRCYSPPKSSVRVSTPLLLPQ